MTIERDTLWGYINSPEYVDNELALSAEKKAELGNSNTKTVLATISTANRNILKQALLSLKDTIRERTQDINQEAVANEETKKILLEQLSSSSVTDNVRAVNTILPPNILIQDEDLNYTIPKLTDVAFETINEITELQYRYNQAVLIQKRLNLETASLDDLFKRVDDLIYLLETL
jgi:hypothetical protein